VNIIKEICQMKRYQFTTLIWEEDGVYVSKCMEIELSSCGDTPKEALDNLREAIDLWLKNAEVLGLLSDALPSITSSEKFTSTIEVEAA
jgi:predicted RNase H-like HicB family nuclease